MVVPVVIEVVAIDIKPIIKVVRVKSRQPCNLLIEDKSPSLHFSLQTTFVRSYSSRRIKLTLLNVVIEFYGLSRFERRY